MFGMDPKGTRKYMDEGLWPKIQRFLNPPKPRGLDCSKSRCKQACADIRIACLSACPAMVCWFGVGAPACVIACHVAFGACHAVCATCKHP